MSQRYVTSAAVVAELVRKELDEDFVGLWKIPWHVRHRSEISDDEAVQSISRMVLANLTASGARLGALSAETGTFEVWEQQQGAIARVMREWKLLGRDPNIGEIAWLAKEV